MRFAPPHERSAGTVPNRSDRLRLGADVLPTSMLLGNDILRTARYDVSLGSAGGSRNSTRRSGHP